jgi:hypothetical protein
MRMDGAIDLFPTATVNGSRFTLLIELGSAPNTFQLSLGWTRIRLCKRSNSRQLLRIKNDS